MSQKGRSAPGTYGTSGSTPTSAGTSGSGRDTNESAVNRSLRTRVQHVKASELGSATAQTRSMQRLTAITGGSVGSEKIWMGETLVSPQTASDNHHRGESETAISVPSGNPEFVFQAP
jgi:uncharacterized RmlC-like cupin family protein